jgi:hypothetical protein
MSTAVVAAFTTKLDDRITLGGAIPPAMEGKILQPPI